MGLLALVVALVATGTAHGAQPSNLSPAEAQALVDGLGGKSAGAYFDGASNGMVVTVTGEASAARVRAAGGMARVVEHGGAELERIAERLGRAGVGGTAWGIDPVENKVVLTLDATVNMGERARLEAIAEPFGDAVRVEPTGGVLTPLAGRPIGGDPIYLPTGERCSLGFNVMTRDGAPHFLTAGHCGRISPTWSTPSATTVAVSYPGNDFALARYNDGPRRSGYVNLHNGRMRDIRTAGDAYVGQAVQKSGSSTGLGSGAVSAIDQSVNYGNGEIIDGLVRTNLCAGAGDSGGSLFAGTVALGLVSGGTVSCATGGETFFQPVKEALAAYGVFVY